MTQFCDDADLDYWGARTRFRPGEGLLLDEQYRLAHLPLVARDHPKVIPSRAGTSYIMGRHDRTYSIVLPVPYDALSASSAFRALEGELRSSPLAGKIAWDLAGRRCGKLHATICGSRAAAGMRPAIGEDCRRALRAIGPVHVQLRGLFSGNVNVGRLYLRVYPERRGGVNIFQEIQRAFGARETSLYVVGVHNLSDDLDAEEAAALADVMSRWWDRTLLRFAADRLWLLGAHDDLVLDSAIEDTLLLVESRR